MTRSRTQIPMGTKKEEAWAQVVGRRERNRAKQAQANPPSCPTPAPAGAATKKRGPKRRSPRTSAVVLNCPKGQSAELMAEVRTKVKLAEVGLSGGITTKTGATGAMIIEIPGPDLSQKADALADRMRQVLHGREDVRVDRPVRTAKVRIRGLDDSVRSEEAAEALAEKGGCSRSEVATDDIRNAQRGQGSLWARLLLAAAKKAVERGSSSWSGPEPA